MTTTYLFGTLEPTNGQVDVYITNVYQTDYSDEEDLQNQFNILEGFVRGKAGNPSNYQFDAKNSNDSTECNALHDQRIIGFTRGGLNVQQITYFTIGQKNKIKTEADFFSVSIPLPHLSSMLIQFQFDANYENLIFVYDYNGTLIRKANNYFGDSSPLMVPQNISGQTIFYRFEAQHKNTPPNGDEPWWNSWGMLLSDSANTTVVGWKDRIQNVTYRNAVAVVNRF